MSANWFEADRHGLAKIVAGRQKFFVVAELWSNAIDEDGVTEIDIVLETVGHGIARLSVEDNSPKGFSDLKHAYTLYAPSYKKDAPEKIGRFDLGEKLVLALCNEAEVISTTGTIHFNKDGTRTASTKKRARGSQFCATIRMTKAEVAEVGEQIDRLCVRDGIKTTYNGRVLQSRPILASFKATLPTVIGEELRPSSRQAEVRLYVPMPGFPPTIYELGVPVVESDNAYDVDVRQKVPLGQDRDSVTPRFLKELRVAVLNNMHRVLTPETAAAVWIADAVESSKVTPEALASVVRERFGDKVLSYNPRDQEANSRATAAGYNVVHGATFSKAGWENLRSNEIIASTTSLFKAMAPLSGGPDAPPVDIVDAATYSDGMRALCDFTKRFGAALIGAPIRVRVCRSTEAFSACFESGGYEMTFNLNRLGHAWFRVTAQNLSEKLPIILHELAHHYAANHLSDEFHRAVGDLGSKGIRLALTNPALFALDTASASDEQRSVGASEATVTEIAA